MNLFTRNSQYYHLLKCLLFLLKHPVYIIHIREYIYTVHLIIYLSNTQSWEYVFHFLEFRHCRMKHCTVSYRVTYI